MECPTCSETMFDNRAKKESGEYSATAPDFKCKDKTCVTDKGYVTAVWQDKKKGKAKQIPSPASNEGPNTLPWERVSRLYRRCANLAFEVHGENTESVDHGTSTLFIYATKGTKLEIPGPKPTDIKTFEEPPPAVVAEDPDDSDIPF